MTLRRWNLAFVVSNLIGSFAYVLVASRAWANPEEGGQVPITGEPVVWAAALPIAALFLVANLVWGSFILKRRDWQSGQRWLHAAAIWVAAVILDFAHH